MTQKIIKKSKKNLKQKHIQRNNCIFLLHNHIFTARFIFLLLVFLFLLLDSFLYYTINFLTTIVIWFGLVWFGYTYIYVYIYIYMYIYASKLCQ